MTPLFIRISGTLAIVGLVSLSALAQPGVAGKPNPGGDARLGVRGLGAGGFGVGLGASAFIYLLQDESIRNEVGVKSDAYAAFEKKARAEIEKGRADRRGAGGKGNPDRNAVEEARAKSLTSMIERQKADDKEAESALLELLPPGGMDRLMGIYVQWQGNFAALNEIVAKKIGMSEADLKKIDGALLDVRRQVQLAFLARGGDSKAFDSEQRRILVEETMQKSTEAITANLTDAQKKALEDLKGAKFELPESLNRFGSRPQGVPLRSSRPSGT